MRLRVADRSRSEAWLERVLGLRALAPDGARSRHGTGDGRALVELREVPGARHVPRRALLGLYHYAILLPSRVDLGRFLVHLGELGEKFGASDHLFSEALYLTDPDGITVEVYADRPRETWVHQGADLVGTLDPLDAEGLARVAGATRWQGVPDGAVMGHVHLYVGDLAAAERFYVDDMGFAVSTRLFPGALFVAAGGYHHHVGVNVWAAGHPVASDADAGLDAWSLAIPSEAERAAVADRLVAEGWNFEREGTTAIARDPWGIPVRIGAP
ncbi:MAG TPA: VOC family protein [Candidatus Eisenbacteria bacterium]